MSISSADPIPRGQPLRESVYRRIASNIALGLFTPGEAITEASISEAFGVSRTPTREALLRLESEGVLVSELARGFTVRPLSADEAEEIYPIHAALESLAVRSCKAFGPDTYAELARILDELEQCNEPVERWRLDSSWHSGIVNASNNSRLISLLRQSRMNISRYELTYMREVFARESADRQHRQIWAAIHASDLRSASELLEQHWMDGMKATVEWLNSTPASPATKLALGRPTHHP
ncbi:GntR family transcriptional regulator [Rhodococcus sp. NPDC059968]|uniref:GntR family transcriptional regulator n=1 Tax=Rhodococcus sp. NPDC059968 TaxID=3347017 RepID=UPI00366B7ADB